MPADLVIHPEEAPAASKVGALLRRTASTDRVMWVTWNLTLNRKTLKAVITDHGKAPGRFRWPNITFFVPHPYQEDEGVIPRWAVQSLTVKGQRNTVRGVVRATPDGLVDHSQESLPEVDEPLTGRPHAKLVLRVDQTGRPLEAIVGSFNASQAALYNNYELSFQVTDAPTLARLLAFVQRLERASPDHALTPEDCKESRRKPTEPAGGPAKTQERKKSRKKVKLRPWHTDPRDLRCLAEASDELLNSWPPGHPSKGWQVEVVRDLVANLDDPAIKTLRRDLLYLPVGLGKTFIAIRLALHMVAKSDRPALYLVPNQWIEQSVKRAMETIVDKAAEGQGKRGYQTRRRELLAYFDRTLRVHRSTQVLERPDDEEDAWCLVVADEVHNWSASGKRPTGQLQRYSSTLDYLGTLPHTFILGLSATPCRFEHDKYSVPAFLDRFLGLPGAGLSREAAKRLLQRERAPYQHLDHAIKGGLLARPVYHPIDLTLDMGLREFSDSEVSFGDYNKVVLRRFWDVLDGDRGATTQAIANRLVKLDCRRIVVFLPGVERSLDGWPEAMTEALERVSRLPVESIDFRNEASKGRAATRAFNRFAKGSTDDHRFVLYAINRFSEGVSVDDIDGLVCLRATLSPLVAVQQIGRGLRLDVRSAAARRTAKPQVCHIIDGVSMSKLMAEWERQLDSSTGDTLAVAVEALDLPEHPRPGYCGPTESLRAAVEYFEEQMNFDEDRICTVLGIREVGRWERVVRPYLYGSPEAEENIGLQGLARLVESYAEHHQILEEVAEAAIDELSDGPSWLRFLRTYHGPGATSRHGDWMLAFRVISATDPRFKNKKSREGLRVTAWHQLPEGFAEAVRMLLA